MRPSPSAQNNNSSLSTLGRWDHAGAMIEPAFKAFQLEMGRATVACPSRAVSRLARGSPCSIRSRPFPSGERAVLGLLIPAKVRRRLSGECCVESLRSAVAEA